MAARNLMTDSQYRHEILYNLPLPLIILNDRGQVSEFNQQAKDLFGHIDMGKPVAFIIRNNMVLEAIQQVNQGHVPTNEVQLSTGFSIKRHFAVLISNFSADEKSRTAITFIDRTLAAEAEKMRSDFVANVSHELRTPLTSILGFIETLQGPAGAEKKTREKFLAILHQQAERIFRLATDQLSLARIEQTEHQIPQDECDLSVICSRVMTSLQNHAEKAKIALKFQPSKAPLIIRGNQDELVQMVQNLVENGIRYGRPNGEVSITLTQEVKYRAAPQTRFCCIEVRDTGEGIDKMHLPRLTERFYRVDKDRSRTKGGTGLGLAIVKHIVSHHQGHLEITSEIGVGSVFCVYLPLS
jgi:two-component system phosphate regulon sensor histidine kinase PhoR